VPLSSDPEARARQLANLSPTTWPAPPIGNVRALRHGANSEVAVGPYAALWSQTFFAAISEESALRNSEPFTAFIALGSKIFGRLELVGNWLEPRMGDLQAPGVMQAIEQERALRREAMTFLQDLKLAPVASEEAELVALVEQLRADLAGREMAQRVELVYDADPEEADDGSR
jgi:hypothetical protein